MDIESFAGTIGYGILKDFIVEFDYDANNLKLWKNSDLIKSKYDIKSDQVMTFSMAYHLPVIKAKVGGKDMRFGLDCGAESNMVEPEWKAELEGKFKVLSIEKLGGADTNYIDALKVSIDDVSINNWTYQMNFLVAKLFGGQHEVNMIDGLIGYQFLSSRKTAVNYIDNELYLID